MSHPLTPMQVRVMQALVLRGLATAKEIGADLALKSTRASQHLGEMFFAGHVERENIRRGTGQGSFEYQYRPKPPKVEAPATQWRPEARFAERVTAEVVEP